MMRVTIKDAQQTVSFLVDEDTALRLVAACSSRPVDLGELLVAGEVYQKGIAAQIMAQLMEFDKRLRRHGPGFLREMANEEPKDGGSLPAAFQVVDELTERAALAAGERGLVVIDLLERAILASEEGMIAPSGEVFVQVGEHTTDRAITYILPKEWEIRPL